MIESSVLRAFRAAEPPRPLSGGQGTSWAAGDLIFKPVDGPVHAWLAEALDGVSSAGFRLATPVRTIDGSWSCEGWSATRWVEGVAPDRTKVTAWLDIIEAGRAFHRAVAHLRRPTCLAARDDRWAVADRVAWDEHDVRLRPEFSKLDRRLRSAFAPLGASQVVHGDLTDNVLFSPALPPAIIDVSPYWRPPECAEGVIVADALSWHGAHASLLDRANVSVAAVARALAFRMATTSLAVPDGVDIDDHVTRYGRAAAAIGV